MKNKIPLISPDVFRDVVDISNTPIFDISEVCTSKSPYKVTVLELISKIDLLATQKRRIEAAQSSLTNILNDFLSRP